MSAAVASAATAASTTLTATATAHASTVLGLSSTHAASSTLLASTLTPLLSRAVYSTYRLTRHWVRNTRFTPIVSYLGYKYSGYADSGPISGITISDFVGVWTPYAISDSDRVDLGRTRVRDEKDGPGRVIREKEGRGAR